MWEGAPVVQGDDLVLLGNEVSVDSALHALTHDACPAPAGKVLHLIVDSLHPALADLQSG